jgi:MFS family permease
MLSESQKELKKLSLFGFFWMFLPIIPILVPYQLSLGLNMQQVFFVQVFFGLICAACEVPSGYISDLWGRKGTLLAGSLLWALGFGYLYFVNDFVGMLIYEGILGVAVSLVSGTDIALLYDWLKQESNEREMGTKALANYQMSQVLSEAVAGGLCGLLILYSYQHVLFAQFLAGAFPIIMVFFLKEPAYEKLSKENHWKNMQKVWMHVFNKDPLLRLIFINQIIWSLSTFVMVWLNQKIWQAENIPLSIFGLLWALSNLVVGLTGRQVNQLEKRLGSKQLLIGMSLMPIIGYLTLAISKGWIVVLLGLLFPLSRGITQILLKDAINWRTPSAIRATVLSLNSLLFRLGFAILGPITGWVSDYWGLHTSLALLALIFALAWLLCIPPLLKEVPQLPNKANPLS